MEPSDRVEITLRDVYAEVLSVKGTVQTMTTVVPQVADHENRLRALEKWRYALPPALLCSAASLLVALLEGHHG